MRKTILAVLVSALLTGPLASIAAADDNPIREAFCRVADKLGVTWVQDCNFS
jgi:hypothetical protein